MKEYEIQVLLNRADNLAGMFRGYVDGDPMDMAHGTWAVEGEDFEAAAERMFTVGQHLDFKNTDSDGKVWPTTERSISVGDILMISDGENTRSYAVESLGWRRLYPMDGLISIKTTP